MGKRSSLAYQIECSRIKLKAMRESVTDLETCAYEEVLTLRALIESDDLNVLPESEKDAIKALISVAEENAYITYGKAEDSHGVLSTAIANMRVAKRAVEDYLA